MRASLFLRVHLWLLLVPPPLETINRPEKEGDAATRVHGSRRLLIISITDLYTAVV